MWTIYHAGEVVDLVSDQELSEIMREAEHAKNVRVDVIIDLVRETVELV
jgi:hypothetical protein